MAWTAGGFPAYPRLVVLTYESPRPPKKSDRVNDLNLDVSVIIPAHNAARYICDALDSVFLQAGVALEVIVVDNGSTDRTGEILEQTYGSLVKIIAEPRLGIGFARNAAIHAAVGRYIALLDADDIWSPDKLALQLSELASHPEGGLVFCHGSEFYDPHLAPHLRAGLVCRPEPYAFLLPSALLAARTTFLKIGDFPHVSAGEFIAWYGWAQSLGFPTFIRPEVLVRRRVHASNTSRGPKFGAGYLQSAKWLMDRRRVKSH